MCYLEKTHNVSTIQDKDNNYINEKGQTLNTWKEYMRELFNDENVLNNTIIWITGPEVRIPIKGIKNNKAPGPDEIHGKMLKLFENE